VLRAANLNALSTGAKLEERFEVRDFAWGPRVNVDLSGFLIWSDGSQVYRRDANATFLMVADRRHLRPYIGIRGADIAKLGVSADGSTIAAWDRKSRTLHLYAAHPHAIPLAKIEDVHDFAFSKAGRQLAYRTSENIYVTNMVANIPPTRVQGTRSATNFGWSPVTTELLVWQDDWVCLTVDGKPVADGRPKGTGPFVRPRWSPDATRLAIQRNVVSDDEQGAVWVLTRGYPTAQQLHPILPAEKGPFDLVGWTS
jgi:hypothetical protein